MKSKNTINTLRTLFVIAGILAVAGCDQKKTPKLVDHLLSVENLYIKPVEIGKNTAAYGTFSNPHPFDVKITDVDLGCTKNELHTHITENNVMKMRRVPNFLVPQGGKLTLQPGGDHLMCIDAKKIYSEGDTVDINLTVESPGMSGTISLKAPVKAPTF